MAGGGCSIPAGPGPGRGSRVQPARTLRMASCGLPTSAVLTESGLRYGDCTGGGPWVRCRGMTKEDLGREWALGENPTLPQVQGRSSED
eukprot:763088-Hanusia_phi.AAC.5